MAARTASDVRGGADFRAPWTSPPEDLLGALAQALEARVTHACPGRGERAHETRVEFLFRAEAVPAEERAMLLSVALSRVAPAEPSGLTRALFPSTLLAELAPAHAGARSLHAAWVAYRAPRGPGRIMGILNVTPDSFSDGGRFLDPAHARARGAELIAEGADWLDVGGESTRPGATPVAPEAELARVLPVITELAPRAAVSIDTTKARVAEAALAAGACVVNDVSAGLCEPEILARAAEHGAGVVLMHRRGTPRDMQHEPRYADVVREVAAHLRARAAAAWRAGVALHRIALDPGLGFGKDLGHNLALVRALPELTSLGFPLVVGLSRKRFLGELTGLEQPERRGDATTAGVALAHARGASVHRVHDVRAARAALAVAAALAEQD